MSKRHTRIFTGFIMAAAMTLSGTAGVFTNTSNNVSAASNVAYVVAFSAASADTFYVSLNGKLTKIRIAGIDAPEATSKASTKKGCYATQAKSVLKQLIKNKFVRLETDPKLPDKYTDGSLLRYVYFGSNNDVGATMIYNGAAKEYMYQHKNYTYRSWYKSLQTTAYNNNLGIWNSTTCPMNR